MELVKIVSLVNLTKGKLYLRKNGKSQKFVDVFLKLLNNYILIFRIKNYLKVPYKL